MLKRRSERRAAEREENATQRFVAFHVGEELYGLDIASVLEIDRMQPITRVPHALSFVEGVIRLRGAIIPVVDLSRRLGLPPIAADKRTRVIIANLHGKSVGLIVTAVTEVVAISSKAIDQAPELTFEHSGKFVTGMTRVGEGLMSILSLDRILSTDEIAHLSKL